VGTAARRDGLYVTFDDALPSLVDFRFTTGASGSIALSSPYGGYDEISVGAPRCGGYTNNGTSHPGGGDYFVSVARSRPRASSAPDSTGVPDIVDRRSASRTWLLVALSISNGTLELTGITLAILPAGEDAAPLVLKADVT
jgi:hypothetical protein